MNKIKVACFGLQGFGNNLLEALIKNPKVEVTALYSRKSAYKFGYYDCETLESLAEKFGVTLYYIPDRGDWSCADGNTDLAIISSFHRIFKKKHLDNFNYTINIHPALLPAYRGATPTNWMVKNGEKIAGLSAHLVDEGIDTGAVLFRSRMLNPYLNDNDLRKALSFLSEKLIDDIVNAYPDFSPLSDEGVKESFQSGRTNDDAILKLEEITDLEQLIFHIKAFTNFPMPKIQIGDRNFVVDYNNPRELYDVCIAGENFSILGYWEQT